MNQMNQMNQKLGEEFPQGNARTTYLKDNCDAVEEKGYMKPFAPEEILAMKENLSETDIQINDVECEKKEIVKGYKLQLEPLFKQKTELLQNIKQKARYTREICYKFIDNDEKIVGYYDADGNLIDCRPANIDELQGTIFQLNRTGTNS